MTTSNSAAMTLEERVVQKIKDDTLMAVIGDEDAILELATRAIREALYQPQRFRKDNYGGVQEVDSIAVATARTLATKAATKAVEAMVAEVMADERVKSTITKAIADAMPAGVLSLVRSSLIEMMESNATTAAAAIQEEIMRRITR